MDKKHLSIVLMLLLLMISFSGCTENNGGENLQFSITSFEVEPSIITEGEIANLSWVVLEAQTVSIDNGIGTVSNSGSRVIQPLETTTYMLTTSNKTKTLTATTQIIVYEKSDDNSSIVTPSFHLIKDDDEDTLVITSADPEGLKWSNFSIVGDCDISGLGTYVVPGDTITNCTGIIIISHIPTNTLIGSWTFSEVIPSIQFVKDDIDNKLIVASVSPSNLLWSEFSIFTNCSSVQFHEEDEWVNVNTGQLSGDFGYVKVGDYFRNLKGECSISIRHIDSNTLIGTWDFT
jgi:hypothetical protein